MPIRYEYLPKQYEFLKNCDTVRHPAYIGGFGSGKTHILSLQSLREATTPSYGLIGAATYRMLADTTQRKFFQLCPKEWIKDWHKAENKVTLVNGTEIIFRSLDSPERLTNLEIDWFALDELGEVKLDTFRMLQGRLRKPGGSHHGFGVGNPAGPTHWTYDYFVIKARQYPDTYRLTQATSYENTFLEPEYAQEMAKSYGEDSLYYKRFVLGQFVAFEGAYWPYFDIAPYPAGFVFSDEQFQHILRKRPLVNHEGKEQYILNPDKEWHFGKVLDFGFEHAFVCMWYITDLDNIIFFDEHYQRHMSPREHCLLIRNHEIEHYNTFRISPVHWAYTDHDAVSRNEVENAKDAENNYIGFTCVPAEKIVMEGILLVQTIIGLRGLYITERCANAKLEIPSYRAKPEDKTHKEEPLKEKDHTCDCIRMTCWELLKHKSPHMRLQSTYQYTDTAPETLDNFLNTVHKKAFS